MHPSRTNKATLHSPFADRTAEWLLTHCPLSALTLLLLLVARIGLDARSAAFVGAMLLADVGLNVLRISRSRRRSGRLPRRKTIEWHNSYADPRRAVEH